MKKVKITKSIFVPKKGVFKVGQIAVFDDDYADHVVKNMKAGELIKELEEKTEEQKDKKSATKSTKK
mgnify:CR=1 FL=1